MNILRAITLMIAGLVVGETTKHHDDVASDRLLAKAIATLRDERPQKRVDAAESLAHKGLAAKDAVDALITAVKKDENVYVRRMAAYALGKIGPAAKDAVPLLIASLKDEDMGIRTYAAFALCEIEPNESSEALVVLLEALRYQGPEVQTHAADLIGRMGPSARDAVPTLVEFLRESLMQGSRLIPRGYVRVRLPPAKSEEDESRITLYVSPGEELSSFQIKPDPVIRVWDFNGTDNGLNAARKAALLALGKIGAAAKEAIPAVLEATHDPDPEVSQSAKEALEKITPPKIAPERKSLLP